MDNFLYFLRFKAINRWWLTKRIALFIFFAIAIFYLINLLAQLFLFNYPLGPQEFLVGFAELLLLSPKLTTVWAPEIILFAIFGAILLWFLVVMIPWISEAIGSITTPGTFTFEPEDCLNNIDFQGKVEKRDKEFSITSSGSGMLLKHYWRDFEAIFEFRFLGEDEEKGESLKTSYEPDNLGNKYCTKNNYMGFIFRARDFDNYFMLSVGVKKYVKQICSVCEDNLLDKKFLLITPHIRVDGAWDVFTENKWPTKDVRNFSVVGDNKLRIQVKRSVLSLWIEKLDEKGNQKNKKEKDKPFFTWHLPTHYLINWGNEKKEDSPGDSSKIPFRNSIGRMGFRAYGDEKFLVRNLTIEKILVL